MTSLLFVQLWCRAGGSVYTTAHTGYVSPVSLSQISLLPVFLSHSGPLIFKANHALPLGDLVSDSSEDPFRKPRANHQHICFLREWCSSSWEPNCLFNWWAWTAKISLIEKSHGDHDHFCNFKLGKVFSTSLSSSLFCLDQIIE